MKKVLFVDDLRAMSIDEEADYGFVTYARTLEAALATDWRSYDIILLDHDLGLDANGKWTDVREFVSLIEEASMTEDMSKYQFHIVTSNPVGRKWMRSALRFCKNVTVEVEKFTVADTKADEEEGA